MVTGHGGRVARPVLSIVEGAFDNCWRRMCLSSRSDLLTYSCFLIFTVSLLTCSLPVDDGWAHSNVCCSGLPFPVSLPPDTSCLADSLSASNEDSVTTLRVLSNKAFRIGERLVFSVQYGPVKAGQAFMEVKEITNVSGRDCYHLISEARTNDLFSNFFEVQDRVESFMDVEGLFPWRFEKHLREGSFRSDIHVQYDQVNHIAITNKDTMDVPPFVQDILSGFYYGRIQQLKKGESFYIDHYSGSKIYPLEVKVVARERIKVPAGVFKCVVIEPVLQAVGIFKHSGRLRVWLTDDKRRIPVLMKSKMIIGSVEAKLIEYNTGEKN